MRLISAVIATSALVIPRDVLHTSPAQFQQYACRIESGGQTTGPSADICAQVVRRWMLLVGTPPAPGEIRLVSTPNYHSTDVGTSWVLEWPAGPKRVAGDRLRKKDGLAPHIAENIIPHEAGHHVFTSFVWLLNTPSDGKRYGTLAPDWIDEAPAIWMESRALRQQRMKTLAHSAPSLAKLVTMTHPAREFMAENSANQGFHVRERTVTPPCIKCTFFPDSVRNKYRVVDIGSNANGRADTVVWYSVTNPNRGSTMEDREFYPLCYSLLRFIRVRGGQAAVQELIGRYRDNPAARAEVLEGLPGLPSTLTAFEQAWIQFIRNPPPEEN